MTYYFDIISNIVLFSTKKKHSGREEKMEKKKQEYAIDKQLIINLSKNDFKVKYAGSYFGVLWAFVQPIVQILIFWFVFQIGFKSGPVNDYPFVLWLIAGMVPWFFYSDAINNATNCFVEYSFLVKKVVFNIDILPIVKILSSMYVHLFFIIITCIIYILNGFYPDAYYLQLIYYTICTSILVLTTAYLFSSLVIFFKDLGQIIVILLQILNWLTPIMWNYSIIDEKLRWLLQLNPVFYIVEGYRDIFINKHWFFDHPINTIYFWGFCLILALVSKKIYISLKPHFADVL